MGTRSVEQYQRPEWTFDKVLYLEKEGLYECLIDAQWPERNDCALLTSKGFASRAARDLIDLLGETDEPLTVFAAHDADGAGTLIYQALLEATKARPRRKVDIVNLGLEPAEAVAMAMGHSAEPVKRKNDAVVAVADYVNAEWTEWFQTRRIELNAMSSPQFMAWFDEKMEPHNNGKLIPPSDILHDHLEATVRANLHKSLVEKAIREAGVDKQVEADFDAIKPQLDSMNGELEEDVIRDSRQGLSGLGE